MISAGGNKCRRKVQCKETEELYSQQFSQQNRNDLQAFADKYSKVAVKRLLLFHFEKTFRPPNDLSILSGPEALQNYLRYSQLEPFVQEFAPEIPELFVSRVNWDVSGLVEIFLHGANSASFPKAFDEPVKTAALVALDSFCRNLLNNQNSLSWNLFSADLLSSHFTSLLTAEEIVARAKGLFLAHYCRHILTCSESIVKDIVILMNREHLEHLHELIVNSVCKMLLNVGHDTEEIVQRLSEAITVLRRLDKSGFLIDQLLCRVRLYLKHRKDLNKSLLRYLLKTTETFSLSTAEAISHGHVLHFDELQNEQDWEPEPTFVTESASKLAKSAHPVTLILLSLSSIDALQEEFLNFLTSELLRLDTDEVIRTFVTNVSDLKKRCGFELPVAAEVMLRDVLENRTIVDDVSVTVISSRYWPERSSNLLSHPESVSEKFSLFSHSFCKKNSSKTITWRPHMDEVDLEITFTNGTFQFRVPPEAAILLSSFDFPADSQESFNLALLSAVTGLADKNLLKAALLYWLKKRVIEPCPDVPFHFRFASIYDPSNGECVDAHLTLIEPSDEFADEEEDIDAEVMSLQRFWPIMANMFKTFGQLSLERIHSTLSMFSKEYKGPISLLSRFLQQKVKEGVLNVSGNKIIVYSAVNK